MSHPIRDIDERLSAYADGELSPEEAEDLRRAIEGDPVAEAILRDHRALSEALRLTLEEVGEEADLSGFADAVMARIEAERPAPAKARRWFEWRGRKRAPIFAAAAAALATLVVVAVPLFEEESARPMLLAGDPTDASIVSMSTFGGHGATVFKTSEGTTIIYVTGN